MVKYILSLLLLLVCMQAWAALEDKTEATFQKGVEHLQQARYAEAITVYEILEKNGHLSPELYCNLGNAYYGSGQIGKAALYYEKALALSPLDTQLMQNSNLINPKEMYEVNGFLQMSSHEFLKIGDNGVFLAVGLLLISSVLFLIQAFSLLPVNYGRYLYGYRYLFGLSILVLIISVATIKLVQYDTAAVITIKDAAGRMGPSERAKKIFDLQEGEKAKVIRQFEGWYKIKKTDGKEGWIPVLSVASIY